VNIVVLSDRDQLAEFGAAWIATRLRNAIRLRGRAVVAFSGGSTPRPMLAALAGHSMSWGDVEVFQVDERCAPDGHEARNASLLDVLPAPRRNVHLMPVTAKRRGSAADRYAAALPERFDVVHLGLGDDGHTASWPPGDPVLDSPAPVAVVPMFNGWPRMTLTLAPVNLARQRIVEVAGASKVAMVDRWLLGDHTLPISAVRRTGTTVVLDADAAAGQSARRLVMRR
jgi:6-phosphogluconolactonase